MARALLHLDPASGRLLGVWTDRERFHYVGHPSHRIAGADAMARWVGGSWDEWVSRLVERTPTRIWWEEVEVAKGETPAQVFQRILED